MFVQNLNLTNRKTNFKLSAFLMIVFITVSVERPEYRQNYDFNYDMIIYYIHRHTNTNNQVALKTRIKLYFLDTNYFPTVLFEIHISNILLLIVNT